MSESDPDYIISLQYTTAAYLQIGVKHSIFIKPMKNHKLPYWGVFLLPIFREDICHWQIKSEN